MAQQLLNETAPTPSLAGLRRHLAVSQAGVFYALLAIAAVMTVMSAAMGMPSFLGIRNVANILYQAALVGILVNTMTLVLISGNFDLSVAAIAALCAAAVLYLGDMFGFAGGVAATLVLGLALGALNGSIVQGLGINAFIVTLGTMTALRGLLLAFSEGRTITATDPSVVAGLASLENGVWMTPNLAVLAPFVAALVFALVRLRSTKPRAVKWALGVGAVLIVLGLTLDPRANFAKPVYYLFAVTLATTIVLNFTVIGRRLRAVGSNVEAARLLGINVTRYKIVPFMLNGLAAAVVGILFSARLSAVSPAAMSGMELTVISAAILGGTSLFGGQGSILKSVAGALVLFSLLNGFNLLNLGATLQGLIEGIAIIVAAAIYRIGRPAR